MADYITTQQYPPLIPPKSWGSEEKKFLNQLTDILDDIYRRYGRLRFEDLGTKLKTRIVASEDILLEVSQERIFRAATEVALLAALAALTPPIAMAVNLLWYDTTNKLFKRCTAVGPPIVWETLQANEIHTSFIDIANDSIDIGSGGSLNITAPTLLSILAGSGSSAVGIKNDTYFLFAGSETPADAPFSVTMAGVLKALTGLFAGTLKITNPNNTDEQIILGQNDDGDYGGFITSDGGTTFTRWLNFPGLVGDAIIPGSLPNTVDAYTSLLLHFFGENASTSFLNSSQYPQTITAYGNAQISTAQSKFGGSAGYFDGTGDYLTIPDSDLYNFGSGDFTIDAWIWLDSYSTGRGIIAQEISNNDYYSFRFVILSSGKLFFSYSLDGSSNQTTTSTGTVSIQTWHHVSCVRNSGTITLYIDGAADGTNNISTGTIYNSTNLVTIGAYIYDGSTPLLYMNGYIDELRISKGIARWTANFTPPTEAYTG